MTKAVTCYACGSPIRVVRRDFPDPVVPAILHVYTMECPTNPVHMHAQGHGVTKAELHAAGVVTTRTHDAEQSQATHADPGIGYSPGTLPQDHPTEARPDRERAARQATKAGP